MPANLADFSINLLNWGFALPVSDNSNRMLERALGEVPKSDAELRLHRLSRKSSQVQSTTLEIFRIDDRYIFESVVTTSKTPVEPPTSKVSPDKLLAAVGKAYPDPLGIDLTCHFRFPDDDYTSLFPLPIPLQSPVVELGFKEIRGVRLFRQIDEISVHLIMDRPASEDYYLNITAHIHQVVNSRLVERLIDFAAQTVRGLIQPVATAGDPNDD